MSVSSIHTAVLIGVMATTAACSGEGVRAPTTLGPYETRPGDCPTTDVLTEEFHAARDEGKFGKLAPHIDRILFDAGGLRVLVRSGLVVIHRVNGDELLTVFDGWRDDVGVARMSPHVRNVLDYITGAGNLAAVPGGVDPLLVGEHYEPVDAMHRVFNRCDIQSTLAVTRRVLELEETLEDGTVVPWIEPAFDAIFDVASDPAFVALLEEIELEDETPGGGIRVGRDAFILIARLATSNIAADNFDLAYLRGLLDDALVFRLPEETGSRQRLGHLFDVFERVVDPNADIFPYVQSFVRCVNEQDSDGAFPGMLYDYLTADELDYVAFIDDIGSLMDDPAGIALRSVVISSIRALEEEPALTRDALFVGSQFYAPEASRDTMPALYDLHDDGVWTALVDAARAFVSACEAADPPPPGANP